MRSYKVRLEVSIPPQPDGFKTTLTEVVEYPELDVRRVDHCVNEDTREAAAVEQLRKRLPTGTTIKAVGSIHT